MATGGASEGPPGDNVIIETPAGESLRIAYQSVSDCHKELAEFRSKLLALLPVATGTGVFLLLTKDASPKYIAVGTFGVLFTVGLFIFERRGVTMCKRIAETGAQLEYQMGLEHARFKARPDPTLGKHDSGDESACPGPKAPGKHDGIEWVEVAGGVVYGAVFLAWLVVMAFGFAAIKPAYCSNVSDLQQSVDDLKGVKLESGALSTLQTDVKTVQSNADAVVSSAKQDFPSQTSALKSSVSSLSTAVNQLPASPTAAQLAPLVPMVSRVVTAANGLKSASTSACD